MTDAVRARTLQALRDATQFEISPEALAGALSATPDLLARPERVAEVEGRAHALLMEGIAIPVHVRSSTLPVLGNIAEALVESMLVDFGWQPLYDDDSGQSAGHGVYLLMLDSSLSAVIALEVKSTIQRTRWPRLASDSREQMTPAWLGRASNVGMREWTLEADDVYSMTVQVHLDRLKWRACIAAELKALKPVSNLNQLLDVTWSAEKETDVS